ncbi:uncharacterized protein [Lolium perenne]|uniref:uncharacterized protein n=1 Tax=Lolium perenne TaxID=4522 RepID=UPI003A9A0944
METAIGAANWLVSKLLNKLSDDLVAAFVASSELGLNSEQIKTKLNYMQGLLHVAQDRGVHNNPGLQSLLEDLSKKADEAEDALDELHYFMIQDQLDGTKEAFADLGDGLCGHVLHGRHAARHTIGNWLPCFSCSRTLDDESAAATIVTTNPNSVTQSDSGNDGGHVGKLKFDRVAMSNRIKSVIEGIHNLCDPVSDLLNKIPNNSTVVTIKRSPTGSTVSQDKLFGRSAIFEQTVNALTGGTYQTETLSVLPIVGPGGMGKTTFTQHLYNDKRVEGHFTVKVWVCVSTDFDVLQLTRQILSCIPAIEEEKYKCNIETASLDQLQKSIAERLKSNRFLIVLDDIWKCNTETDWKNLLSPFTKGESKGNMVLVTTRFPSIAQMVETTDPIELGGLEPNDFFTLFEACIFDRSKLPGNYEDDLIDVARDIARKLKGSPLAANTVGKMKRLEELKEFHVKKENVGFELKELGELSCLGGELSIYNLETVRSKGEASDAKLKNKTNLKKLRCDDVFSTELDDTVLLHSVQSILIIELQITGELFSKALRIFPALSNLEISECRNLGLLPAEDGGLSDLRVLQSFNGSRCGKLFSQWPMGEVGGGGHAINPFPTCLKELYIWSEPSMQSMGLLSNLTSLTSLTLIDCSELTIDGFNPLITVNLKKLYVRNEEGISIAGDLLSEIARSKLMSAGSFQLEHLGVDSISAVLTAPICSHLAATLHTLRFSHDQRMTTFTEEQERALLLLTSLQHLGFYVYKNLQSLPRGLRGLSSLKSLVIERCEKILSLPPKEGLPTSLEELAVLFCSPENNCNQWLLNNRNRWLLASSLVRSFASMTLLTEAHVSVLKQQFNKADSLISPVMLVRLPVLAASSAASPPTPTPVIKLGICAYSNSGVNNLAISAYSNSCGNDLAILTHMVFGSYLDF